MPDYQKGKIYKIWSPHSDDIYIGSSTQDLAVRMGKHRSDMDCTAKSIINLGEAKIELIELYPCNSKIELNKREGYFIRSLDCVNICISGRTKKEYYEENKEKVAGQTKIYRENNKEIISKKMKAYREANKEQLAEKLKVYYAANIEAIREKNRVRGAKNYLKKKEQLAEKN